MFKIGDLVQCEDIKGYMFKGKRQPSVKQITLGNLYKVYKTRTTSITIKNDEGVLKSYSKKRFRDGNRFKKILKLKKIINENDQGRFREF